MKGEKSIVSSTAVGQNKNTARNPGLHTASGEYAVLIVEVESNAGCVLVEVRCENPSELISQSHFLLRRCGCVPAGVVY